MEYCIDSLKSNVGRNQKYHIDGVDWYDHFPYVRVGISEELIRFRYHGTYWIMDGVRWRSEVDDDRSMGRNKIDDRFRYKLGDRKNKLGFGKDKRCHFEGRRSTNPTYPEARFRRRWNRSLITLFAY